MLTRLPLSLMVELAVDCSTKYSVPSALMNSGGGFSSAISAAFGASRAASLALYHQGDLARWVPTDQGRESVPSVGEHERRRHWHHQVSVLGELQDPAAGTCPERPAGGV